MYDYKSKNFNYEADSSIETWENWYSKMYSHTDYMITDYQYRIDILSGENPSMRLHKKFKWNTDMKAIKMSGDCDFNFNDKKKKAFIDIIKKSNDDYKSELITELNGLHKNHHSFVNYSLLPTTGKLNNIKGVILSDFDRFDTFIYYLDLYYKNGNDKILPPLDSINFKEIKRFLDGFKEWGKEDAIYNYCRVMYNNNQKLEDNEKELINLLIANGSKSIREIDVLKRYFKLAQKWWDFKDKHNQ